MAPNAHVLVQLALGYGRYIWKYKQSVLLVLCPRIPFSSYLVVVKFTVMMQGYFIGNGEIVIVYALLPQCQWSNIELASESRGSTAYF